MTTDGRDAGGRARDLHLLRVRLRRHRPDVTGDRITKAKNACVLGKALVPRPQPDGSRPSAHRWRAGHRGATPSRRGPHLWPPRVTPSSTGCPTRPRRPSGWRSRSPTSSAPASTRRPRCATGRRASPSRRSGEATCTLGEIKNRADLVIFWGGNPGRVPPAPLHEVLGDPEGHVRAPTAGRTATSCWSTCGGRRSARAADLFIQVQAAQGLRGAVGAAGPGQGRGRRPAIEAETGVSAGDARRPWSTG